MDDRPRFPNTGNSTFQLVLLEGSNEIVFVYEDVIFGSATLDNGASATVGIASENNFRNFSLNTPSLSNGLAIRFTPRVAEISCPENIESVLGSGPNCGDVITYNLPEIVVGEESNSLTQTSGLANGSTFPLGTTTNTFEVMNINNTVSTCSFDVTISTIDLTITSNGETLLSNQENAIYQWFTCPSDDDIALGQTDITPITGETDASLVIPANGQYSVMVTLNGCADTSECTSVVNLGTVEDIFGNAVQVYPNPTEGRIVIDILESFTGMEVRVTDAVGNEVAHKAYASNQQVSFEIDGDEGIYFVEIITPDRRGVTKIVKQ